MTDRVPDDFHEKVRESDRYSPDVDRTFGRVFDIERTPPQVDRLGIDRIWTCKRTHRCYSVEYKLDLNAHKTGNLCVASVEREVDGDVTKYGWGLTCVAQLVAMYVPAGQVVMLVRMEEIERRFKSWTLLRKEIVNRTKGIHETFAGRFLLIPAAWIANFAIAVAPAKPKDVEWLPRNGLMFPPKGREWWSPPDAVAPAPVDDETQPVPHQDAGPVIEATGRPRYDDRPSRRWSRDSHKPDDDGRQLRLS